MEAVTTQQRLWTTLSLLNWSTEHLASKGFESPRLTTELLLTNVLKCSRIDLYTNYDRPLMSDELAQFKALFKRRLAHEPVQYILRETEFMGMRFIVDTRVLIPRPETEVLVEQVVKLSKQFSSLKILDVGTGSGNIAISLAKYTDHCDVDAIDVSQEALEVAQHNVVFHCCESKVKLYVRDILSTNVLLPSSQYNIIVANPPYISQTEYALLQPEVSDFEPKIATTDGHDGLTFYRALTKIGKEYLTPKGWIVVEFAYNQHGAVGRLFNKAGYKNINIIQDYSKIPRVLKAQYA